MEECKHHYSSYVGPVNKYTLTILNTGKVKNKRRRRRRRRRNQKEENE
jgi:hypothetical protein